MIDLLKKTLLEKGLAGSGDEIDANILFLRETLFQVFLNGRLSFVVKAGKPETIHTEFDNTAHAKTLLGDLVPAPLVYVEDSGYKFAVYEGVRHTITYPRVIEKKVDLYVRDLERFSSQFLNSAGGDAKAFCSVEQLRASNIANIVLKDKTKLVSSINSAADALARTRRVPQHSDFSLNNIGMKSDGSGLVIFDWEEYGSVDLFGFDMFIFLASYFSFEAMAVHNFFNAGRPSALRRCVDAYCAGGGVATDDMYRLAPLYLAEFLNLKTSKRYGDEIIHLVSNLLEDFLQAIPDDA